MQHIFYFFLLLLPFSAFAQDAQTFAPVDSGYVKIRAGRLFYRIYGAGKPIVFLNGGPGLTSDGYVEYAENLSEFGQVILFDQRGTGKSLITELTKPGYHDIRHLVHDLERLREHLGHETWTVVGHSFGGLYAMHYLSRYAERADKAVLSASPVYTQLNNFAMQKFPPLKPENMTRLEQDLHAKLLAELEKPEPNQLYIYILKQGLKGRYYVTNPANYDTAVMWFTKHHAKRFYRVYSSTKSYFKKFRKNLAAVETPILIIHGQTDFLNISNPLTNHEFLQNSTIKIVEDSGHMISVDQPEIYYRSIGDFLVKK